jgi:myo-inositol-1(or 4)-monophosphatase
MKTGKEFKMKSEELQKMFETAKMAALEGGKILKENFGRVARIEQKEGKSFVTNVDTESESRILKILKSEYPDHNFVSEEAGAENNDSDYTWVIDPLDGTHNYIHSLPFFAVSIALKHLKEVVLGVVYLPLFDELFHSVRGGGAFLNGQKIAVSETMDLGKSVVIYSGALREKPEHVIGLGRIVKEVWFFRNLGAAAIDMCYVASGRIDTDIERNVREHDFAAGQLLVEEAGGKVTGISGGPVSPELKEIVASNGLLHKKVLEILNKEG